MSSTTAAGGDGLPDAPRPGSRALAVAQRVGLSLMLPIAVLPAAGLLLRFGASDMLGTDGLAGITGWNWLLRVAGILTAAGNALFGNLPLLFAVGVAIGFARKADGSTALAAVVGYLVFDRVSMVMFAESSIKGLVLTTKSDVGVVDFSAGNPSGVLGGIIIGIMTALLWQRFYRVKLPQWLAFFGGRRFVPIITAGASVVVGVIFGFAWPPIGNALQEFAQYLSTISAAGAGIYGVANRLLIPFGLHHILNNFLWFQFGNCQTPTGIKHGDLTCYFAGAEGTGTYMAGFFPIMMFALPAAALAMTHAAKPHRRKAIGGFMFSAAAASLITGITEPIEYSFMFVAPVLYVIHAVLTGFSMALADLLNIKIGFFFSAGLIDYLLNFGKSNTSNPLLILLIGAIYAVVYYFLFRGLIRLLNIPTPGREPDDEAVTEGAPQATGRESGRTQASKEDVSPTGGSST